MDTQTTDTVAALPAHHPFGMSAWPALISCPHYRAKATPGEYAADGTASHKVFETGELTGDDEIDRPAKWAIQERARLFAEFPPVGDACTEKRVTLQYETLPSVLAPLGGVFGTADLVWTDKEGFGHVFDYKTFATDDESEKYAAQIIGYAVAAFGFDNDVIGHIALGGSRKTVPIYLNTDTSMCVLMAIRDAIVFGEQLQRCAGDHCQYCDFRQTCSTLTQHAEETVPMVQTCEKLPLLATADMIVANPAAAARFMVMSGLVKKALQETEDRIKAAIDAGVVIEDPEQHIRWIRKPVKLPAEPIPLAKVLASVETMPDDWLDRVTIGKSESASVFGKDTADLFQQRDGLRLMKEKI